MPNPHSDKVYKGKWSDLALWRRNRFAPPDRLFFPIVVVLLFATAVLGLLIKLF